MRGRLARLRHNPPGARLNTFADRISLFSQSLFALPLDTAIMATAEAGYPAIELACRDPHFGIDGARTDAGTVARGIRDAGLITSALSLFNSFTNEATLLHEVEQAATFIRLAPTFGARVVKLTPGPPASHDATETHWRLLDTAMRRLVPIADDVGVLLAFETHMRQLTDTLSGTRRLLDMAPSETVGVTVDFSNFSFAGEDLRRVIPALGSRMVNAHVKNGSLGPGGAWLFNDLATGLTDYAEVLPMLRDVGYTGHLAIECLGRDAASRPVETATRDLAILRRYIDAAGEASS